MSTLARFCNIFSGIKLFSTLDNFLVVEIFQIEPRMNTNTLCTERKARVYSVFNAIRSEFSALMALTSVMTTIKDSNKFNM